MKKSLFVFVSCIFSLLYSCKQSSSVERMEAPQEAASFQEIDNQELLNYLPFQDSTDFFNARKGLLATFPDSIIKADNGRVAVNFKQWDFLNQPSPNTANPSLWRQSQLNSIHGLFEVVDGIYQIRGFDLANMSIIRGNTGWIIVDPLTSSETAKAGLELVNKTLGKRPVQAVLITHSHIDHFGGVRGVVNEKDLTNGKVQIIAPAEFYDHSIQENVIAGNAMKRRALYMYGALLPKSPTGNIGNGLGQMVSLGSHGILQPTTSIESPLQEMEIDGIKFIFQNTPGAEAPAEYMFYLPAFKAFCQAEEINHNLHNLYTLRGAQVRNGQKWAKYIDETIQLFGDKVDVSFGSHHWPTWGNKEINAFWSGQRDTYKYIHDQTLYLANQGYTMNEIANSIQLPDALAKQFANRGYYGTVSHNAKAQYQLYYGWFDGNPANLNPLPTVEESKKYIEYMGGVENVLSKAKEDFDKGEYRWVSTVLNKVVFANPSNQEARNLLAKTYSILGYQAESGPWRNFYLTGAAELVNGIYVKEEDINTTNEDIIINMPLSTFYDFLAVRMDRSLAKGKTYTFNLIFPDIDQSISLYLVNEVLHNRPNILAPDADATITMNKSDFNDILLQRSSPLKKYLSGKVKIEGDRDAYSDFQKIVEKPFQVLFNIIEP